MGIRAFIVPALLALTLLTGATTVAAAQEEPTMTDMDIEGLRKMYGRSFAVDMSAMMDTASPAAMPSGWWVLTTLVLEFDSEDTARAGFETMREEAAATGGAGASLEEVDLDLGDLAYSALRAEDEMTSMLMVTAQDGEYVYAVVGLTFGEEPAPLVESVLKTMRDADTSDDAEVFREDGASTGGLWAKLPSVEDVTSRGEALTVAGDTVYYPAAEGTPAA